MRLIKNVGVLSVLLLLLTSDAMAGQGGENFSEIARGNVFRLNPSKPVAERVMALPELPQVRLGGLTTLLGSQALLTIQTKTKPVATEASCVLGEGQSRDGVSVLRIDMGSGTVWLTNQGEQQVLRIKP